MKLKPVQLICVCLIAINWNWILVDAQCLPCVCHSNRHSRAMPEIRQWQVTVANCSHLNISEVPNDLSTNILALDISHTNIQALNQSVFERFRQLRFLAMRGNNIRTIADNTFHYLTDLELLYVTDSKFPELPVHTFSGLELLRKVIGLHVDTIQAGTFSRLERLTDLTLIIENNTVPEMLFQDMDLDRLELTVPHCTTLPEGLFGMTAIAVLKIIANEVTSFPDSLFHGVSLLHDVYIEADKIRALPADVFQEPPVNSDMDDAGSGFIEDDAVPLVNGYFRAGRLVESSYMHAPLTKLTLVGIDIIDQHLLTELYHLETLIIQHSLISDPNTFSDLRRLKHLEVSHSDLSNLNLYWLMDVTGLNALNLSSNNISQIDGGGLRLFHNLTMLDLSHNNISHFGTEAFDSLRNSIKILDLSYNNICEFSLQVFKRMYILQELNLQGNCLEIFPAFWFTDNVTDYDADFGLFRMAKINLGSNNFKRVSFHMFSKMRYLQEIDLSNNSIRQLYFQSELPNTHSGSIGKLDLSNNPLHCSCVFKWISRNLMTNDSTMLGECETPDMRHGLSVRVMMFSVTLCPHQLQVDPINTEMDEHPQYPKPQPKKEDTVMDSPSESGFDYFWVKVVLATTGTIAGLIAIAVFVVKMRGVLYTWDGNTRRFWHV